MTTVNTKGLVLGMLAIGGLIAGGAMFTGQQAYAQLIDISPVNAAAASNSDDDFVVQSNVANVKQKADVDCDAKVSDDDKFQIGDNFNIAANECEAENESTVLQGNFNSDDDVQIADATSCQALALLVGANVCDTTIDIDVLGGGVIGAE
jgi:hypothetical protein